MIHPADEDLQDTPPPDPGDAPPPVAIATATSATSSTGEQQPPSAENKPDSDLLTNQLTPENRNLSASQASLRSVDYDSSATLSADEGPHSQHDHPPAAPSSGHHESSNNSSSRANPVSASVSRSLMDLTTGPR